MAATFNMQTVTENFSKQAYCVTFHNMHWSSNLKGKLQLPSIIILLALQLSIYYLKQHLSTLTKIIALALLQQGMKIVLQRSVLWPFDPIFAESTIPPFQFTSPFHRFSPVFVDYCCKPTDALASRVRKHTPYPHPRTLSAHCPPPPLTKNPEWNTIPRFLLYFDACIGNIV